MQEQKALIEPHVVKIVILVTESTETDVELRVL
jgi:hypothetical protein